MIVDRKVYADLHDFPGKKEVEECGSTEDYSAVEVWTGVEYFVSYREEINKKSKKDGKTTSC